MRFTKFMYSMKSLKFTYLALDDEAMVSSLSLPSTARRSFTRRVKFCLSAGEDDMPALLLVGYSQSRSIPSRLNFLTAFRQFWQNFLRWASSAAISLKLPAPQPPMESTTFRLGWLDLSATIFFRRDSPLILRVSKSESTLPKA